jgi:hypothetical protein
MFGKVPKYKCGSHLDFNPFVTRPLESLKPYTDNFFLFSIIDKDITNKINC